MLNGKPVKKGELVLTLVKQVKQVKQEQEEAARKKLTPFASGISPEFIELLRKRNIITVPLTLDHVKTGMEVYRLMTRYNPQLGVYHVFDKKIVTRVSKKSVSTDCGVYSKETGERKGPDKSVYGSSSYELMTEVQAIKRNAQLIAAGQSVRGLETKTA